MKTLSQHMLGALVMIILATAALYAQSVTSASVKDRPATEKQVITARSMQHLNPAEHAFQANCSRCHSAPEGFSPRITGTVVRHMRVRANLSADDERLILSYLNP
jgi:cytochrome c5